MAEPIDHANAAPAPADAQTTRPATAASPDLRRRDFLQISGGVGIGLIVAFALPFAATREAAAGPEAAGDAAAARATGAMPASELNAFLRIEPDGSVVCSIPKSEMGQGVLTSLAMLLAEELEVDWSKIRSEHAIANEARYGRWRTGGSSSVRETHDAYRRAGATARTLLVAAAAERWQVAAETCRADRGTVVHAASGRRLAYAELAERAAKLSPPAEPALKPRSKFSLIGKDLRRLDTPAKVDGSAVFGLDVRVPGMLVAQVERPPDLGGQLASFDAKAALAVPGVVAVFEIPRGVAIVAKHFWAAQSGRKKLAIRWTPGPHGALDNEAIRKLCTAAVEKGAPVRTEGDVARAVASAGPKRTLEAVYDFPFLAHATLEPMNCTAKVDASGCELWVPTQSPTAAADAAAKILGIPADRVRVNTTLLGGGFGRRGDSDFVEDAVHIAKQMKAPVQVVYTREDDMRAGLYRPTGTNLMRGAVDAEGWPVVWEQRIASQSLLREKGWPTKDGIDFAAVEGVKNLPYAIPNVFVSWADVVLPVSIHWWRSVGSSQNGWVTECFFDELCRLGGKDPLAARKHLLKDHPRHVRVLEKAASEAGFGKPLPKGHALGIAVHESFGSIVAETAEVSLDADGTPRVHRVVCVVDCGEVVHPAGVRHQMESGITMGLSAALWGEVAIEKGRIVTTNYDRYPIARIDQTPRIETFIIAEGDAMGGIGEPGTPPIAPAICNALLALTGKPIRRLPIGRVTHMT
ncbi:MAG: xanthine dehydrogenase family protein molybdopterin-binding subunit [Deltaproteobacteria bacterium]|nr:xanthine dehydrogenase family protein molybdopterin-binding subunit [Deltaproteobacteria bacterium]